MKKNYHQAKSYSLNVTHKTVDTNFKVNLFYNKLTFLKMYQQMRILLAVLALGLASALDINAEWTLFKKTYNKVYNDAEDEGYR